MWMCIYCMEEDNSRKYYDDRIQEQKIRKILRVTERKE